MTHKGSPSHQKLAIGITIDSYLTWREHVYVLSHKVNATLALLRRNLKPCSLHIKSKSYICYVAKAYGRILIYRVGSSY